VVAIHIEVAGIMRMLIITKTTAMIMDRAMNLTTDREAIAEEVVTTVPKAGIDIEMLMTIQNGTCLPRSLELRTTTTSQAHKMPKEDGKISREKACLVKDLTKNTANRVEVLVQSKHSRIIPKKKRRSHTSLKHLQRNLNTKSIKHFQQ
jgi:hypothetical protein